jgi:hypothetical protein
MARMDCFARQGLRREPALASLDRLISAALLGYRSSDSPRLPSTRRCQDIFIDIEDRLIFQVEKMAHAGDISKFRIADLARKQSSVVRIDDRIFLAVQNYGFAVDLTDVNGIA